MKNLLLSALFLFSLISTAQGVWSEGNFQVDKEVLADKPAEIDKYELDEARFLNQLLQAPDRNSYNEAGIQTALPLPEGLIDFSFYRTYSVPKELSDRYGGIYSFKGVAQNGYIAHISYGSSAGFAISIDRQEKPTILMKAFDLDDQFYVSYARDQMGSHSSHDCQTEESVLDMVKRQIGSEVIPLKNDMMLRTYRAAISTTGEFSQRYLDGTETNDTQRKAKVLTALNSNVTRLNGIFERDFGLNIQLVPNNDRVIYLNPATDPYTSSNSWNGQLQNTLDTFIGSANYDVGHLFVFTGGVFGNAGCIACVCTDGSKGSAFTAHNAPSSDDFNMIAAHEFGHQFGGFHIMGSANCRSGGGAQEVEPGSGSSIMGYAGICNPNIQNFSDDYFNYVNIRDVIQWTRFDSNCAQQTVTNNNDPNADAGSDFTIPKSTPFILSGSGSDVDAGDVLSYCWEQNDPENPNTTMAPFPTQAVGPIFRSFLPTQSSERYIPKLSDVLANNLTPTWEVLPSISRTIDFALTVRDNAIAGAKTDSDEMTVTVDDTTGPFTVTVPAASVQWTVGTTRQVTWNVAGTDQAPINTQNVDILLSVDNGQNFQYVLAQNTPNDGSEQITVPVVPDAIGQARIMVRSVGNIYYALNNGFFTVRASDYALDFQEPNFETCQVSSIRYDFTYRTYNNFSETTTFAASNLPAGVTASFSPASASADGTNVTMTLSGTGSVPPGRYDIKVNGTSNGSSVQRESLLTLDIYSSSLAGPVLNNPVNNAIGTDSSVVFDWNEDVNVGSYLIEISSDQNFSNIVQSATTEASTFQSIALNFDTVYFWRVTASNICNASTTSSVFSFQTECGMPDNVGISQVRSNSIQVSWEDPGNASSWLIEVVPSGATPTGNGYITSSSPYTIIGLNPGTPYDLYINAECGSGATSDKVGPVSFRTQSDYCGPQNFYDDGGPNNNYSNNRFFIRTVYPDNGSQRVRASFNSFDVEDGWDFLFVIDGPNTDAPILAQLTGNTIPNDFVSSHPTGSLSFLFFADGSVNEAGYDITITCETAPRCNSVNAPFLEDFALSEIPDCWKQSGDESWLFTTTAEGDAAFASDFSSSGNTNYAYIDGSLPNGSSVNNLLTSPEIDVTNLSTPAVEFYVYSSSSDNTYNTLTVDATDQNGNVATLLTFQRQSVGWSKFTYDLTSVLPSATSVQLSFRVDQNASGDPAENDILIDDVTVDDLSTFSNISPSLESAIRLFPNPTQGVLNVSSGENGIKGYQIYGVDGRRIQNNLFSSPKDEFTINLQNLSTGMYFLELSMGEQKVVKRFIKK